MTTKIKKPGEPDSNSIDPFDLKLIFNIYLNAMNVGLKKCVKKLRIGNDKEAQEKILRGNL